MKTLSVAIMSVPERRENVARMLEKLDCDERNVHVQEDTDHIGIWANARGAWSAYRPGADYHLVLQDDLLLCRDFLAGVQTALEWVPEGSWISMLGTSEDQKRAYMAGNTSWFISNAFNGTALGAPTGAIDRMLDWTDRTISTAAVGDDHRLWAWMMRNGDWCWHTVPTLAEHVGAYVSTRPGVRGKVGGRELTTRGCFIGEDESALDVNWSVGAEKPPVRRCAFPKDDSYWAYPGAYKEEP